MFETMKKSTFQTPFLFVQLLTLLVLTASQTGCSKAESDEVDPRDQYAGTYSGSLFVDFTDATRDISGVSNDVVVAKSSGNGEMTINLSGTGKRDLRLLTLSGSTFTVKRFSTVLGTGSTKILVDGSGEFSGNNLTYREKVYDPANSAHVWTDTYTMTKK